MRFEMNHSFAVLVLSCDKYSDMWGPFLRQFRRFFPVGDYPIYFGSNKISCSEPAVIPVLSGEDPDWSTSLKNILGQIKERKLFIILEDLFLAAPADEEGFRAALSCLFEKDARHINYWGNPPPDLPTENPRIGIHLPGAPYRVTANGFWDREYLINLLVEGETPWNFEIFGSYRTAYSDGFYGLTRSLCVYHNMVEKGCWIPKSIKWARENGIALELNKRPLLSGWNQFVSRAKMHYFHVMLRIPWCWRVALMNKLRRAVISY